MNTSQLKDYAPKARRDFIAAVTERAAHFGLTQEVNRARCCAGRCGHSSAASLSPERLPRSGERLEERIRRDGFEQVMEAIAYTWFNRFVAIRYMELHGYLDHGYRVLSHPDGKGAPEILEHAADVDLPGLDREKVDRAEARRHQG